MYNICIPLHTYVIALGIKHQTNRPRQRGYREWQPTWRGAGPSRHLPPLGGMGPHDLSVGCNP